MAIIISNKGKQWRVTFFLQLNGPRGHVPCTQLTSKEANSHGRCLGRVAEHTEMATAQRKMEAVSTKIREVIWKWEYLKGSGTGWRFCTEEAHSKTVILHIRLCLWSQVYSQGTSSKRNKISYSKSICKVRKAPKGNKWRLRHVNKLQFVSDF